MFNHECRALIGYATLYLFCDRQGVAQQSALANKMVAASRFRSVYEDLDSLWVEAVPEKTKVTTKYGMKIFEGKNRSEKTLSLTFS